MGDLPLPPIERLQAVEVRPGDVVLATVPPRVTRDQAEALREALRAYWPANGICVVSDGVELAVYRPGEER